MRTFAAGAMILFAACWADAATTWTGTGGTDWGSAGNWSSGLPGDAVFSGAPTANQPNLNGANRAAATVDFQTAGWTVGGTPSLALRPYNYLSSAGAGVNTVEAHLTYGASANSARVDTMQIVAGNRLVVGGTIGMNKAPNHYFLGSGTLVVNGAIPFAQDYNVGSLTVLFNGTGAVACNNLTFAAGGGFGGSATNVQIRKYGWIALANGGTFSPGDDAVSPISTMTLAAAVNPAGFSMGGSSSTMFIDIGSALGSNDKIILGTLGNDFGLAGCELALRGGGVVQNGSYTILTETVSGSDYTGTFGSVTYNGAPAGPSNVAVTYNASSIVVTLTGLGISPGTVLILK